MAALSRASSARKIIFLSELLVIILLVQNGISEHGGSVRPHVVEEYSLDLFCAKNIMIFYHQLAVAASYHKKYGLVKNRIRVQNGSTQLGHFVQVLAAKVCKQER